MTGIQSKEALDDWYRNRDPWGYETNPDDAKRKRILLDSIPPGKYRRVLDVGCGSGFITRDLPGGEIIGIDLSEAALNDARQRSSRPNISYQAASLFDLSLGKFGSFDLIVITGILYPQYVGTAAPLVHLLIDEVLKKDGILVSVHIDEWCRQRFPYLMAWSDTYSYRDYIHRIEVYRK